MLNALGAVIAVTVKCSILFFIYYALKTVYYIIKKPSNVYQLQPEKYLVWRKKFLILHAVLALLFLALFFFAFKNIPVGMAITFLLIVTVYIARICINISCKKS